VLVGVGTVLADDPQLTVRRVEGRNPLRVVVDSTLRIPLTCALLSRDAHTTIVATTDRGQASKADAIQSVGARVLRIGSDPQGRVDLQRLLECLRGEQVQSVLAEGGSGLLTSLIRLRLVDHVIICVAPMIVGRGIDAIGDLGVEDLNQAVKLEHVSYEALGDNVIVRGDVIGGEG